MEAPQELVAALTAHGEALAAELRALDEMPQVKLPPTRRRWLRHQCDVGAALRQLYDDTDHAAAATAGTGSPLRPPCRCGQRTATTEASDRVHDGSCRGR